VSVYLQDEVNEALRASGWMYLVSFASSHCVNYLIFKNWSGLGVHVSKISYWSHCLSVM